MASYLMNRYLLPLLCCIFFTACKKEKTEPTKETETARKNPELYEQHTWHFSSTGYDPALSLPDETLSISYIDSLTAYWPGIQGIEADTFTMLPPGHLQNDSLVVWLAGKDYNKTYLYFNTYTRKASIINTIVIDHPNGSGIPDEYLNINGYAD